MQEPSVAACTSTNEVSASLLASSETAPLQEEETHSAAFVVGGAGGAQKRTHETKSTVIHSIDCALLQQTRPGPADGSSSNAQTAPMPAHHHGLDASAEPGEATSTTATAQISTSMFEPEAGPSAEMKLSLRLQDGKPIGSHEIITEKDLSRVRIRARHRRKLKRLAAARRGPLDVPGEDEELFSCIRDIRTRFDAALDKGVRARLESKDAHLAQFNPDAQFLNDVANDLVSLQAKEARAERHKGLPLAANGLVQSSFALSRTHSTADRDIWQTRKASMDAMYRAVEYEEGKAIFKSEYRPQPLDRKRAVSERSLLDRRIERVLRESGHVSIDSNAFRRDMKPLTDQALAGLGDRRVRHIHAAAASGGVDRATTATASSGNAVITKRQFRDVKKGLRLARQAMRKRVRVMELRDTYPHVASFGAPAGHGPWRELKVALPVATANSPDIGPGSHDDPILRHKGKYSSKVLVAMQPPPRETEARRRLPKHMHGLASDNARGPGPQSYRPSYTVVDAKVHCTRLPSSETVTKAIGHDLSGKANRTVGGEMPGPGHYHVERSNGFIPPLPSAAGVRRRGGSRRPIGGKRLTAGNVAGPGNGRIALALRTGGGFGGAGSIGGFALSTSTRCGFGTTRRFVSKTKDVEVVELAPSDTKFERAQASSPHTKPYTGRDIHTYAMSGGGHAAALVAAGAASAALARARAEAAERAAKRARNLVHLNKVYVTLFDPEKERLERILRNARRVTGVRRRQQELEERRVRRAHMLLLSHEQSQEITEAQAEVRTRSWLAIIAVAVRAQRCTNMYRALRIYKLMNCRAERATVRFQRLWRDYRQRKIVKMRVHARNVILKNYRIYMFRKNVRERVEAGKLLDHFFQDVVRLTRGSIMISNVRRRGVPAKSGGCAVVSTSDRGVATSRAPRITREMMSFTMIIRKYRTKVMRIQHAWRGALKMRRAQLEVLVRQWNYAVQCAMTRTFMTMTPEKVRDHLTAVENSCSTAHMRSRHAAQYRRYMLASLHSRLEEEMETQHMRLVALMNTKKKGRGENERCGSQMKEYVHVAMSQSSKVAPDAAILKASSDVKVLVGGAVPDGLVSATPGLLEEHGIGDGSSTKEMSSSAAIASTVSDLATLLPESEVGLKIDVLKLIMMERPVKYASQKIILGKVLQVRRRRFLDQLDAWSQARDDHVHEQVHGLSAAKRLLREDVVREETLRMEYELKNPKPKFTVLLPAAEMDSVINTAVRSRVPQSINSFGVNYKLPQHTDRSTVEDFARTTGDHLSKSVRRASVQGVVTRRRQSLSAVAGSPGSIDAFALAETLNETLAQQQQGKKRRRRKAVGMGGPVSKASLVEDQELKGRSPVDVSVVKRDDSVLAQT